VLNRLVSTGNTIVVIEHNLDVIKTADWIIDMGPEGGDGGGTVVAVGTPEEVAQVEASHTGRYLKKVLAQTNYLDRGPTPVGPVNSSNGKEAALPLPEPPLELAAPAKKRRTKK